MTSQKTVGKCEQEELELIKYLDKIEKENYGLKSSIKAWETAIQAQVKEYEETEQQLDEFYRIIWAERENFCSKADTYTNTYGVLSHWWQNQTSQVSNLEITGVSEDEILKREVEELEKELEEIREQVRKDGNTREKETKVTEIHLNDINEIEISPALDGNCEKKVIIKPKKLNSESKSTFTTKPTMLENKVSITFVMKSKTQDKKLKKILPATEDQSKQRMLAPLDTRKRLPIFEKNLPDEQKLLPTPETKTAKLSQSDLFSMVDVHQVREATRKINRQKSLMGKFRKSTI